LIEQIISYKTLFFDVVIAIGYALLPAMNKNLHAPLVKICTSGGGPLSHGNKIQKNIGEKVQPLLPNHQHPPLTLWANIIE